MTADRFELLLAQRLILRDLDGFIDGRIRRIHGRRVADLLHELLARRGEGVETALEGLHLQYPGYAEEIERRFIRRTALRLEEWEYATMRRDGLIGAELHAVLMQDIGTRRAEAEGRPQLDVAVQKTELVRRFPLFAGIEDAQLKQLSRVLRTRYVNAGDIVVRKDGTVRERLLRGLGRGRARGGGPDVAAWPRRDVRAAVDPDRPPAADRGEGDHADDPSRARRGAVPPDSEAQRGAAGGGDRVGAQARDGGGSPEASRVRRRGGTARGGLTRSAPRGGFEP